MEPTKVKRTPFDAKTLQHFKNLLLDKRREAEKQVDQLESSLIDLKDADDADYSSIAHHMGDVGSDVEEEQLNYQLLERTKKYIGQIDDALTRIVDGTYGICQATGQPISLERLEAVPHTRYSIEAKRKGLVDDH